jgi:F0F1-type ATP synthase gamma subunit
MIKNLLILIFTTTLSNLCGQLIKDIDYKIQMLVEKETHEKLTTKLYPEGERTHSTFDKYDIIKVKTTENGIEKKVSWFFYNDTLFYSDKIWTKTSSNQIVDWDKCYLQKNSLQAWLNSEEKAIDPNSFEFIKLNKELAEYSSNLIKQIKE